MGDVTEYRLLQHRRSGELWAVRVEGRELTGVFGPLPERPAPTALSELPYDEDRDTADWVIRYQEEFATL
jgi:hypothetical protein